MNLPGRRFDDGSASGCAYEDVRVGVQRGREIEQLVPGDGDTVVFELELRLSGDRDARGPYVHGRPGERFVYLSWVAGPELQMFRRAKLMLADVPDAAWHDAQGAGLILEGTLTLTDARGRPLCGRVRPDAVSWKALASGTDDGVPEARRRP